MAFVTISFHRNRTVSNFTCSERQWFFHTKRKKIVARAQEVHCHLTCFCCNGSHTFNSFSAVAVQNSAADCVHVKINFHKDLPVILYAHLVSWTSTPALFAVFHAIFFNWAKRHLSISYVYYSPTIATQEKRTA